MSFASLTRLQKKKKKKIIPIALDIDEYSCILHLSISKQAQTKVSKP